MSRLKEQTWSMNRKRAETVNDLTGSLHMKEETWAMSCECTDSVNECQTVVQTDFLICDKIVFTCAIANASKNETSMADETND